MKLQVKSDHALTRALSVELQHIAGGEAKNAHLRAFCLRNVRRIVNDSLLEGVKTAAREGTLKGSIRRMFTLQPGRKRKPSGSSSAASRCPTR